MGDGERKTYWEAAISSWYRVAEEPPFWLRFGRLSGKVFGDTGWRCWRRWRRSSKTRQAVKMLLVVESSTQQRMSSDTQENDCWMGDGFWRMRMAGEKRMRLSRKRAPGKNWTWFSKSRSPVGRSQEWRQWLRKNNSGDLWKISGRWKELGRPPSEDELVRCVLPVALTNSGGRCALGRHSFRVGPGALYLKVSVDCRFSCNAQRPGRQSRWMTNWRWRYLYLSIDQRWLERPTEGSISGRQLLMSVLYSGVRFSDTVQSERSPNVSRCRSRNAVGECSWRWAAEAEVSPTTWRPTVQTTVTEIRTDGADQIISSDRRGRVLSGWLNGSNDNDELFPISCVNTSEEEGREIGGMWWMVVKWVMVRSWWCFVEVGGVKKVHCSHCFKRMTKTFELRPPASNQLRWCLPAQADRIAGRSSSNWRPGAQQLYLHKLPGRQLPASLPPAQRTTSERNMLQWSPSQKACPCTWRPWSSTSPLALSTLLSPGPSLASTILWLPLLNESDDTLFKSFSSYLFPGDRPPLENCWWTTSDPFPCYEIWESPGEKPKDMSGVDFIYRYPLKSSCQGTTSSLGWCYTAMKTNMIPTLCTKNIHLPVTDWT